MQEHVCHGKLLTRVGKFERETLLVMKILSFVIPCYGSEDTIETVISSVVAKVREREDFDYEIITVNDCSPDNVLIKLKNLAADDPNIKVVNLARNFGKHPALMAGFSVVTGDYIVLIDDDGQCPVENLWELIDPLENETYDVTMAKYVEKKQSAFKNFGSRVNSWMSRTMIGKPKELEFTNFLVMRRFVLDEIVRYKNPYPYMEGLVLRVTRKIKNVTMEEHERFAGEGNFNFNKSLELWVNGFTAFSVKPLRVSSFIGMMCAVIGFIFGFVTIVRKLIIPNISVGWSSIIAILMFVGGLIMIMLGLIGEYIGRIYISLNNSPQYVIKETINVK